MNDNKDIDCFALFLLLLYIYGYYKLFNLFMLINI